MQINKDRCVDCGSCVSRCPVAAIKTDTAAGVQIELDDCVECGVCLRARVCPADALYQQELKWPRTVRSIMSDVLTIAEESQISGRGTEEMKTNDVTGRFKKGWVGLAMELGRPGVGARMYDVEKVAMAVAQEGVEFEKQNPVTSMMADPATGKFREELLNERVLSAIIEFAVREERVPAIIAILKKVAPTLDTVFSLDICSKVREDGVVPHEAIADVLGIWRSPNGKVNIGLGRPLAKEE